MYRQWHSHRGRPESARLCGESSHLKRYAHERMFWSSAHSSATGCNSDFNSNNRCTNVIHVFFRITFQASQAAVTILVSTSSCKRMLGFNTGVP